MPSQVQLGENTSPWAFCRPNEACRKQIRPVLFYRRHLKEAMTQRRKGNNSLLALHYDTEFRTLQVLGCGSYQHGTTKSIVFWVTIRLSLQNSFVIQYVCRQNFSKSWIIISKSWIIIFIFHWVVALYFDMLRRNN
jgi:hypothetical protein